MYSFALSKKPIFRHDRYRVGVAWHRPTRDPGDGRHARLLHRAHHRRLLQARAPPLSLSMLYSRIRISLKADIPEFWGFTVISLPAMGVKQLGK